MSVVIPNYGCGNLASIQRMIAKVGGEAQIVSEPHDLRKASKVVLAGVGAFDHGMSCLMEQGWLHELNEAVLSRKIPVLGICLGMQLMCHDSEEGKLPGLGWVNARVMRFQMPTGSALKIPHMGWNSIEVVKDNPIVSQANSQPRFYFVHSYHAVCQSPDDVLAVAHYGSVVTAAFSRENVFGVQFHPEKSHKFGMSLMKNFVELPC